MTVCATVKKKEETSSRNTRTKIAGGIVAVIAGFLAAAGITALLPVEPEKAAFILYVLWIFCGGALWCWFDDANR